MMRLVVASLWCLSAVGGQEMEWKKAGSGILCGTEEKKNGWKHVTTAADYEAFRKAHPGPEPGSKMAEDYRPLPDFDFTGRELLVVWAGTMARELDIVAVRPGEVEMYERMLFEDEDRVTRAQGAGTYVMLALPKTGKPVAVKWASAPPEWKRVAVGLMSGIEDKKADSVHLKDAAAYDAFRKTHVRVVGRGKRDARSEPLPDFDFSKGDLVLAWSGTMYRTIELLTVQDGVVVAQETRPTFDEDAAERMVFAGMYVMVSVPRTGKPYSVRWAK